MSKIEPAMNPSLKNSRENINLPFTNSLQGIFWKILSCASFAGINGIVRFTTGGSNIYVENPLPVYVIDFFQNAFATFFILGWILINHKKDILQFKTQYLKLHILRVIIAVLGVGCWYLTLKHMPIAKGVALSFLSPIFTIFCAYILLGEKLDKYRLTAILLSMLTSFIIVRPDRILFQGSLEWKWTVFFPFLSALCFALSNIFTRKLASQGETAANLTRFLILLMTPVSFIFALFNWVNPSLSQLAWLLLLGLLTSIAHFSFSKAYSLADVTYLMPFGFSKFLLSVMVGYLAFAELPPSWQIWLGSTIIFLAGILLCRAPPLNLKKKSFL
ncbi:MAG: hypothetical protein JWM09_983 [Francisellaceae bacterium]|nr:hypothetical protein [Francisellaceae bacterium]